MPKIALKNINVHLGLSEETFCFTATIWVDGKRFAHIKNQGHGGPDDVHPDSGNYADVKALGDRIEETYPRKFFPDDPHMEKVWPEGLKECLSSICSGLITEHLFAKDLKRLLRTNFLAKKISGGGIFQWKKREWLGGKEAFELMAREKGYEPLNFLPFEEALAIFNTEGAK